MGTRPGPDQFQTYLRMPLTVRVAIERFAKQKGISLNAVTILLLEEGIAAWDQRDRERERYAPPGAA